MDWTWHLETNDQFSYELVIYKNKIQDFNLEIMTAYQNMAKSDEQTLSQQQIIMLNI